MADEEETFFDPDLAPSPYENLWHKAGTKVYYAGVDRGMLYPEEGPGVPWPGLTGVDENATSGDIIPFYLDGVRRRNDHSLEEFEATINAFAAPAEFGPCEGQVELTSGMFLGQQPRESFGFSYRSQIGNDIDGLDFAYELNLVYNAMARPVSRSKTSLSESPEAESRSWEIETLPVDFMDNAPSARLRLDSRHIEPDKLKTIEDILYGATEDPRLPTIEDVYLILSVVEEVVTDEEEIPWEELEELLEPEDP